jgi:riboflavin kinase / FMN adenylyltransferase
MKIIESISEFNLIKKGSLLTIGNFDGVHLGHQQILKSAKSFAEPRRAEVVVMTFEPHPVTVLHPEMAPGVLTPLPLKEFLLSRLNVDYLIVIKDNKALLELSPEDFVKWFLVENIKPGLIVEGDDFNFGAGRAGNIETLKSLGKKYKFGVSIIDPSTIKLSNEQIVRVSSTMVRYMLESGHVSDAQISLGRPYRLIEEIVSGRGVGRKLGFPTLNLKIPNQVIPAEGVYAGFVRVSDDLEDVISGHADIPAIYSIGQARTYGDDFPLLIEAHLLCRKAANISGKYMAMDFIRRIRSQHKFNTPEKLAAQITQDCNQAKEILHNVVRK